MKEIYFIRHGQTDENSLGIRQGSEIDSELNKLGRDQAKKTGKYLKKYRMKDNNFDSIISSPMKRAVETAEIIKKMFNLNYTPIGNLSNGKNCWISYIRRDNGIYKLVSPPDSTHIGLNHRMLS